MEYIYDIPVVLTAKEKRTLEDPTGRRRRNSIRQPREPYKLTPLGIEILYCIHVYGGWLTTDIIYRYLVAHGHYKHQKPVETLVNPKQYISKELTLLFHHGYLKRPAGQRRIGYPDNKNLVHQIDEKGEEALKKAKRFHQYAPRANGQYAHNMGMCCSYASAALNAFEKGEYFEHQHEVLEKVGHDISITLADKSIVNPDFIFRFGKKKTLFFFEWDRGTEQGQKNDMKPKTLSSSVEDYQEIIGGGLYREYCGGEDGGAIMLFFTTISQQQTRMLHWIQHHIDRGCTYMMTAHCHEVGEENVPPNYLNVLNRPWYRYCGKDGKRPRYDEFTFL